MSARRVVEMANPTADLWRERSLWCGIASVAWVAMSAGAALHFGSTSAHLVAAMTGGPALLGFGCGYWWRGAVPTTQITVSAEGENATIVMGGGRS